MTDIAPTPAAPAPAPAAPAAPAPAPAAPVQVPEGYVPQADLDRVEGQRRGFQSEVESLKRQLAALQAPAPAAPATPATPADAASELAALRAEIARDRNVASLAAHVPTLQTEFEYADPYFFQPQTLGEYESLDALRETVQADHNRIAAIVEAKVAAKEAELKAALGGQSPLGPVAPPTPGVDPTVQQLNAMTPSELEAYQAANPGVVERVMQAAMLAAG